MVQRCDGTNEVESPGLQGSRQYITFDVADILFLDVCLTALNALLIPVDPNDLRNSPPPELPRQLPIPAPNV